MAEVLGNIIYGQASLKRGSLQTGCTVHKSEYIQMLTPGPGSSLRTDRLKWVGHEAVWTTCLIYYCIVCQPQRQEQGEEPSTNMATQGTLAAGQGVKNGM